MKILVTGARGFIGRNLVASLESLRDGLDQREGFAALRGCEVLACDRETSASQLARWCAEADAIMHLAGENRPADEAEFQRGNVGFTEELLGLLENAGNACPFVFASSVQCDDGDLRHESAYAVSKRAAEALVLAHGERTGASVTVFRLANVFGKWCRPNYNSVVATFCHATARELPITVSDPEAEVSFVYVDDVVDAFLSLLAGEAVAAEDSPAPVSVGLAPALNSPAPASGDTAPGSKAITFDGGIRRVAPLYRVTLGELVCLLERFRAIRTTRELPAIPEGSFEQKLLATYLSYLPDEAVAYAVEGTSDARGTFTELLHLPDCGQISVNTVKPGMTKGNHWHHSKWEKFVVLAGEGTILLESADPAAPVFRIPVSGKRIVVVDMPPGRSHSIVNESSTEDLVFLVWSSEVFDPEDPDTFRKEVGR